jgi:hypothetical protein
VCRGLPFGTSGRTAEGTGYELHPGVSREAAYQFNLVKRDHPAKKRTPQHKADTSAFLHVVWIHQCWWWGKHLAELPFAICCIYVLCTMYTVTCGWLSEVVNYSSGSRGSWFPDLFFPFRKALRSSVFLLDSVTCCLGIKVKKKVWLLKSKVWQTNGQRQMPTVVWCNRVRHFSLNKPTN